MCALFYFVFEGNFRVQAPPGGAYIWRGDLTEGVLRYEFGGGLYLEGLIFGILRYCVVMLGEVFIIIFKSVKENVCEGSKCQKVAYLMEQESQL